MWSSLQDGEYEEGNLGSFKAKLEVAVSWVSILFQGLNVQVRACWMMMSVETVRFIYPRVRGIVCSTQTCYQRNLASHALPVQLGPSRLHEKIAK